ncbi:MAG TPA: hypothetical protein VF310_02950 [Vicinamibacteria bacterium]
MNKRAAVGVFVLAMMWGGAERSEAISAYANRYDVACHFCHDGYPKLNAMGQRFKERGFRMANEEPFDFERWIRTVPLAVRASGTRFFVEDGDGSTFGFIKGISAGNLGPRLAYWVDDGVSIHEEDSDGDHFTHNKPDNAWARLELVTGGKLYVRGGRMELDLPFTQTRTPHLFPYEIYFANAGFETDNIADYHHGVEVGGDLPGDAHWSAAVVAGRNPAGQEDIDEDAAKFDGNLFLRVAKRKDAHRFGAFAYIGRNTLVQSPQIVWDDNLVRVGVDLSVWVQRLNLYGVGMWGRNDNPIATAARPNGTNESRSFDGGFLQADWHLRDTFALTARLNVVQRPEGASAEKQDFVSVYPGFQLWVRERFKLSFESGFQNRDRGGVGQVQAELVL